MLISAPRGWTQIHFGIFQMVCDLFWPCSHRQAQTSRLPTCSRHPYFLRFSSSETGIRWFDELKFDDPNSSHHRHLPLLPSNRLVSRTSHASTPGLLCYTGSRFGTLPAPVVYHPCPPWKEMKWRFQYHEFGWIWVNHPQYTQCWDISGIRNLPCTCSSVCRSMIWCKGHITSLHDMNNMLQCFGSSNESRAQSSGWILVVPNYVKNW